VARAALKARLELVLLRRLMGMIALLLDRRLRKLRR
jgi:hypothetical protein